MTAAGSVICEESVLTGPRIAPLSPALPLAGVDSRREAPPLAGVDSRREAPPLAGADSRRQALAPADVDSRRQAPASAGVASRSPAAREWRGPETDAWSDYRSPALGAGRRSAAAEAAAGAPIGLHRSARVEIRGRHSACVEPEPGAEPVPLPRPDHDGQAHRGPRRCAPRAGASPPPGARGDRPTV